MLEDVTKNEWIRNNTENYCVISKVVVLVTVIDKITKFIFVTSARRSWRGWWRSSVWFGEGN